jgi:hypothetical protein
MNGSRHGAWMILIWFLWKICWQRQIGDIWSILA